MRFIILDVMLIGDLQIGHFALGFFVYECIFFYYDFLLSTMLDLDIYHKKRS